MIPYGRHFLDEADIAAVVEVLRNGNLTQGPKVQEFEKAVAGYVGAKYAVAVSSGTAALHLAYLALDVGPGDRVVTTPNTFVATANAAVYTGAEPHFSDIDANTLNLDPSALAECCVRLGKIKAIAPVHFGGLPCDMRRISKVADKFGARVVEDAAHALGACYADGQRVGCCAYSDVTIFSFHPVKMIAAGEGGMVTTNNEDVYHRLLRLRSHGINKGDDQYIYPEAATDQGEANSWYYEMRELGFNYRITDIQCALALSQLKKIDIFLAQRKEIVAAYDEAFRSVDGICCTQLEGRKRSSHHIYVLKIDYALAGLSRHQFMKQLAGRGIGSQVHYIPVPAHPFYEKIGYRLADFPNTEHYYRQALSIPVYFGLSEAEQRNVIGAICELVS